jgi:hypothetical protein
MQERAEKGEKSLKLGTRPISASSCKIGFVSVVAAPSAEPLRAYCAGFAAGTGGW